MLRGRRVVMCVVFIFMLLTSAHPSYGVELAVSATVPLSSVWQTAIETNSTTRLDTTSHQNIAHLFVSVQGVENIIMQNETVQILFFEGEKVTDIQEDETNVRGSVDFTFVYKKGQSYRIIIVDRAHEHPFVIRTLSFNG